MLEFQLTQYPFRLGLAEGTDPRQVPPGTLVTAENCVWKQSGRLEKRFGMSASVAAPLGVACSRLFTRGTELCATDGSSLYAYSTVTNVWRNVDQVPNLGLTWTTAVDTSGGVGDFDQAYYSNGNLIVSAWVQAYSGSSSSGPVYVQLTDANGGIQVAPIKAHSSSGNGVRVVITDDTAHIITRIGANVAVVPLNLATFVLGSAVNLRTDGNAAPPVGNAQHAAVVGSTLIIAYETAANALKLYSYTYAAGVYTQTATGGITGEAGTGFGSIAIDATAGESLYIVYSRATPDVRCRIAVANPSTLVQTVAPVDLETTASGYRVGVRRLTSTSCVATWTSNAFTVSSARANSIVVSNAGALTATSKRGTCGAQWTSQPFFVGTRMYAMALDITGGTTLPYSAPTTYLAEIETSTIGSLANFVPHRYVAEIDPLIGGGWTACLATAMALSSAQVLIASPFQATAAQTVGAWRNGVRQVSLTTGTSAPVDLWRSVTVGQEAYIAGGFLGAYDGRICFDYGMQRSANFQALALGGGGSIGAGNYLYAVVPEYRSSAGMLHRGPTFTITTAVTAVANDKIQVILSSIPVQAKADVANGALVSGASPLPVILALYRTVANGSTLQRLTVAPNTAVITDNQLNNSQTYNDTSADGSIDTNLTLASRPALYTTGGILDDYQPPASVTMFHHADRLWVLDGSQRTWWYSKAFQDDAGTAPGFNPAFLITFDDVQTAGATMDDKAIFFSATGLRYMLGSGPAANGANSDFTAPVVIQSDVGCTNARSVVGTPDGVMFLSDRGIYLLTRGLELAWIGRDIKDELAAYPTITSAVLVAKQNLVRFTCNNTGGTAGIVLVYDYVQKQWTTAKYHDGTTYGCAIADACMWNGAWTFATPAGLIFTESTSDYRDGNHYVPMTLETAWISAAGPLAFQSVREFSLHGTSYTDFDLTVSVGFDSDTSYPQVATFAATSPVTTVGDIDAGVIIGTRRKCSTIRFKITDATPSAGTVGVGRGPAFDMMGLEVGVKKGFKTTPATKRA